MPLNQRLLVGAIFIGVLVVLLRVIVGEVRSWLQRSTTFGEGFTGGGTAANPILTTCPAGTQMFMWKGAAFCCDGRVVKDAALLSGTCKPASSAPNAKPTFCSLGPAQDGVPSCAAVVKQKQAQQGATTCPPSHPNFAGNVCCAGPTTADGTACLHPADSTCRVASTSGAPGEPNEFSSGAGSCEFLRAKETAPCPDGWGSVTHSGQGALADLTLPACSDNVRMCYSAAILQRLQSLGYATEGMPQC